MKSRPYPPYEEPSQVLGEPAVAYQRTDPATYRHGVNVNRTREQEELDELEKEWLRPFTLEELHRRMDEAEANDDADNLLSSEEVFAYMERSKEWLRPFTLEELHRRMDEAEAEIGAGEVMTCEEANAEIRRLLPWLS